MALGFEGPHAEHLHGSLPTPAACRGNVRGPLSTEWLFWAACRVCSGLMLTVVDPETFRV